MARGNLLHASAIYADLGQVPDRSGVYLFYVTGGVRLLEATGYFDTDCRAPKQMDGKAHLYTGAAHNLRLRMKQHLKRDCRSSSFRKTLLAVEFAQCAISKSETPESSIANEDALSKWLSANLFVQIELCAAPFERERTLINRHVSPFNITLRRSHAYSRRLMSWRDAAFPRNRRR